MPHGQRVTSQAIPREQPQGEESVNTSSPQQAGQTLPRQRQHARKSNVLRRHHGQDSIQQKTGKKPAQAKPLQQGTPSQKLRNITYKNQVEERGLVDTNKLTVPAADLVFGLRRLRQLVVVLHVLNHLGQDTGIHVLKRDLVLPVRHVCKTAECRDRTQRKHSVPAQHQNTSPRTSTHQLRFAAENSRAWNKKAPQARAAPTTAGQSAQFGKANEQPHHHPDTQTRCHGGATNLRRTKRHIQPPSREPPTRPRLDSARHQ